MMSSRERGFGAEADACARVEDDDDEDEWDAMVQLIVC